MTLVKILKAKKVTTQYLRIYWILLGKRKMYESVKGFTYKYPFPHSTEGAGSVYQNVFFAYVMASMLQKKFYFYENHINRMGEKTPYEKFSSDFKKIFNFLIMRSDELSNDNDEIILPYAAEIKYQNLNYPTILNLKFEQSYGTVALNYRNYENILHKSVIDAYHSDCTYKPDVELFPINKQNIAVHLRTVMPEDSWGDNDSKWEDYLDRPQDVPYANVYEFFNVDFKTPTENPLYYSTIYARLINNLVDTLQWAESPIVHVFSRGDEAIFSTLKNLISPSIDIRFHLNSTAADCFYHLTKSDLMVCAKSSFSWLASFLNKNHSLMRYPFRQHLSPNCHFFYDDITFAKPNYK